MAKTSSKSKTRVKKAGSAKRSTRGGKARAGAQASFADEEDQIDGCDFEFIDSEATPDVELPPAIGGVELVKRKRRRRPHQRK